MVQFLSLPTLTAFMVSPIHTTSAPHCAQGRQSTQWLTLPTQVRAAGRCHLVGWRLWTSWGSSGAPKHTAWQAKECIFACKGLLLFMAQANTAYLLHLSAHKTLPTEQEGLVTAAKPGWDAPSCSQYISVPSVLQGERWRIVLLSQAAALWKQFTLLNTRFLLEKQPCGMAQTLKAGTGTNRDALSQGRCCRSLPSAHSTSENRREQGVKVRAWILQPCSDSPGEKKELKPMWMYRSFRTHQSSLARRFLMLLNLSNISQQHELFQYLPMGWFRGLDVVTTTVLYPFPLILMSEKDNPAQGTEHWSRCQHSEPVFIHGNYKRCLTFLCWSVS